MPKLLELFSGTGTLAKVALQREWEVQTVDNDPRCDANICDDVGLHLMPYFLAFRPDTIWASPPCEAFSVASIGTHWGGGHRMYAPRTPKAETSLRLIGELAKLIHDLDPPVWYIENPRGVMRKVCDFERIRNKHTKFVVRHTVTYCQYNDEPGVSGLPRMKPTDIWTNNLLWAPRPMCKNGDPCHERAPRGAKTGTQGRSTYLHRSKLPIELCEEVLASAEEVLAGDNQLAQTL